jgi:hypothetical protein
MPYRTLPLWLYPAVLCTCNPEYVKETKLLNQKSEDWSIVVRASSLP